jgi:transcriptional regulator with XRE-family HTH domain
MAKRTDPHRTELGAHFSEASRRLWALMAERGWTQSQLRKELGAHPGEISRLLYGDIEKPRFDVVRAASTLGVGVELWALPPAEPFIPPAARAA